MAERVSRERELLEETLVVLDMVHMDECDLYFAIEELLAKPKQEPVAWLHEWVDELGETVRSIYSHFYEHQNLIPLYASPPTREPLSYDKTVAIIQTNMPNGLYGLARAIEIAHGIGVES